MATPPPEQVEPQALGNAACEALGSDGFLELAQTQWPHEALLVARLCHALHNACLDKRGRVVSVGFTEVHPQDEQRVVFPGASTSTHLDIELQYASATTHVVRVSSKTKVCRLRLCHGRLQDFGVLDHVGFWSSMTDGEGFWDSPDTTDLLRLLRASPATPGVEIVMEDATPADAARTDEAMRRTRCMAAPRNLSIELDLYNPTAAIDLVTRHVIHGDSHLTGLVLVGWRSQAEVEYPEDTVTKSIRLIEELPRRHLKRLVLLSFDHLELADQQALHSLLVSWLADCAQYLPSLDGVFANPLTLPAETEADYTSSEMWWRMLPRLREFTYYPINDMDEDHEWLRHTLVHASKVKPLDLENLQLFDDVLEDVREPAQMLCYAVPHVKELVMELGDSTDLEINWTTLAYGLGRLERLEVKQGFFSVIEWWKGMHTLVDRPQFRCLAIEVTALWHQTRQKDAIHMYDRAPFTQVGAEAWCAGMQLSLRAAAHPNAYVSVSLSNEYAAPRSGTTMQLQVRAHEGNTVTLEVDGNALAAEVFAAYEVKFGVPAAHLRLTYQGHELAHERTLASYGIAAGSVVHVALRLRGGGDNGAGPSADRAAAWPPGLARPEPVPQWVADMVERRPSRPRRPRGRYRTVWRWAIGEVLWNVRYLRSQRIIAALQARVDASAAEHKSKQDLIERLEKQMGPAIATANAHCQAYERLVFEAANKRLCPRDQARLLELRAQSADVQRRPDTIGDLMVVASAKSDRACDDANIHNLIKHRIQVFQIAFQGPMPHPSCRPNLFHDFGFTVRSTWRDLHFHKFYKVLMWQLNHGEAQVRMFGRGYLYYLMNTGSRLGITHAPFYTGLAKVMLAWKKRFLATSALWRRLATHASALASLHSPETRLAVAAATARRAERSNLAHWQRLARRLTKLAAADAEATAKNAVEAAEQRSVREAAAATQRAERDYTASGPSHRTPVAWVADEPPDAGKAAKRASNKAASIRAAAEAAAAKRAQQARERDAQLERLRMLHIGDAILEDEPSA